jgi:hypothetical protein
MTISGLKHRYIADQTGIFNYSLNLTFDNTSGSCLLGFSGNTTLNFEFKSGKIYESGDYLHGYETSIPLNLSGHISANSHDLFINGTPIYIEKSKATGVFSWFYANPENVNITVNEFYINGEIPDYTIISGGTFFSGETLSGLIINNSNVNFRIFSGEIPTSGSNFTFSGLTTGNIAPSGTGAFYLVYNVLETAAYTTPIKLYTDFGDISFDYIATGYSTGTNNYFLLVNPSGFNMVNGEINGYSVLYNNPSGNNVKVFLKNVSNSVYYGTIWGGDYLSSRFSGYGPMSGNLTGSGIIWGDIYTGTANVWWLHIYYYYPGCPNATGFLSGFRYATGDFAYPWTLTGSGMCTGTYGGVTGFYLGSGVTTGIKNLTINDNSGTFTFSNISVTGTCDHPYRVNTPLTQYQPFTGWLTTIFTGSGYYQETASGECQPIIPNDPLIKLWVFETGLNPNVMFNFRSGSAFSTGTYTNAGFNVSNPSSFFKTRIGYNNDMATGQDIMDFLIYTGGYLAFSGQITGTA